MFTLENWIGLSGILYGGGTLFLLLIVLPFADRNPIATGVTAGSPSASRW